MSLVKKIHRLAFLLEFNLIIHHYCTYVNVFILVHLSVIECASIGLTLVRFSLKKGTGVSENCVTLLRLCYHYIYIYMYVVILFK